ncbi:MAG: bifunctional adenosylcobinamide kinase/adenosylcobinamide-phosphate guanylyltransferase [Kiritimatiellia bacterium]|jgi:adenosylcobinamide kinase/adenosylcobinamide-phosphate guanylyltransferase|nr:bifunctional adenosylcobinamide kinase/adenosylcobinamide-phosphate guanylyltransferase [Kiritimatiellia bacterium]MDP6810636.1 bifunctional adenosylcobinamide kinase/adenosylcobinamide-phosphate guanylyltransferase [Kiritimatiellia bacterium]MDP7023721.1 bifunctional adenosylcobinamide kinase/adenosylcobinamide-phosphate guanylyltransferase [Kiritimatiellia bacterium]
MNPEATQHITLVTGGCRSGKSRYALEQATTGTHPVFIATAQVYDAEMEARVARHKLERDPKFVTIEEPYDLAGTLRSLPPGTDVVLVDCLTIWMSNLLCRPEATDETPAEVDDLLGVLRDPPCDIILVTNEVGMGIVPENALARRFRDETGFLNQSIAALADTVVFAVSGIPTIIKPRKGPSL